MTTNFKIASTAFAAAIAFAAPALGAPFKPVGTTDVTVDDTFFNDALVANDISASPIGGATASGLTFSFMITGGTQDTLTIEHSGGIEFSTADAMISVSNFLIEGALGTVSANVNDGAAFVPLFTLANVSLAGPITADLVINETLSNAIIDTFLGGDPDADDFGLSGTVLGSASTSPSPVPLPTSSLLLLAGIGGFAALRRRKMTA